MIRPFIFARGSALLTMHITTNSNNSNLRTLANAAGYSGSGSATIYIDTGVVIGSTTTATAGLVPGTWPSGVTVTLINNGSIRGKGGAGGSDSGGGAGGTALSATGISGYTFSVDNTSGTILGGGGGGAGGATSVIPGYCGCPNQYFGGGGGGGGRGDGGGAGGVATNGGGNGTAGTSAAAGTGGGGNGGGGCYAGQAGGNGGGYGAAGGDGLAAYPYTGIAYSGGTGGNSVTGSSNITWIANGTRTGAVS